jgi:tetratricopeptide (TPR) repeat protein
VEYEKAIQLDPTLAYLYLNMGRNYRALNDFDNAVAMFRRGLEVASDDPWLRFELGKTLFQVGDQELGLRELRKAVELKPDMPDAYTQLGVGLYLRRAYEEAIENMQKAIDLGAHSDINYYIIGLSYLNLEEMDCTNGVPWLQKALQENPEALPALDGLKRCGVQP